MKYRIIEKKGYMAIRSGAAGTGKEVFRVNHWDTMRSEDEACKALFSAIRRLAVSDNNLIVLDSRGYTAYSSEDCRLEAQELEEYAQDQSRFYPSI